jgi:hypothetical protein
MMENIAPQESREHYRPMFESSPECETNQNIKAANRSLKMWQNSNI